MIERIVDFLARNAVLVVGLAASAMALLSSVALGVWLGYLTGDAGLSVAGATLTAAVAIIAHLSRDARLGRERPRRLVELNVQSRKQEALLERMAMTDPLTSVYNRRYFHERLNLEIGRTARCGRPLALALIDLDPFKAVNDTHGHPFGDVVLAETARLLKCLTSNSSPTTSRPATGFDNGFERESSDLLGSRAREDGPARR